MVRNKLNTDAITGAAKQRDLAKEVVLCVDGVLVKKGRMLLLRRAVEPFMGWWHVAGGHVGEHETLKEALHREFLEETGLEIEVGRVLGGRVEETPDRVKLVVVFEVESFEGEVALNGENSEARWFRRAPRRVVFDYFNLLPKLVDDTIRASRKAPK